MKRLIPLAICCLLLGRQASAQVVAQPVPDEAVSDRDGDFAAWVAGFRAAEIAKGVSPAALDSVIGGLHYSPRVVELDRAQPDDSGRIALFSDYVDKRVEPVRIGRGRSVAEAMAADLAANEATTGVPAAIVLGIWGMESSYGAVTGNFDIPRSLATLAFDGRRRALFTKELEATVSIVERGLIGRDRLTGSWAGAMGQPQFLPSSYLKYARDADHDGRVDIWDSRPDVALSIATYLGTSGWKRGQGWGLPIIVPAGFDRAKVRNLVAPTSCTRVYEKHSRWIPVSEWKALGFVSATGWGAAGTSADDTLATLVEPDGPGGRAFLTFGNFRVLLAYNCSNFYALSVGLLGDALR
ncbi:lytic murein transglycosylase [Glacieibacterium megasporae]|uniref:lytic murein transglycosylase n=1 Tax=Glacieibacterium megasporae TaxID=2835787 RepID=UPI002105A4F6|nr:lytic murein transglycosylase [Polymorphobacter megasporae]